MDADFMDANFSVYFFLKCLVSKVCMEILLYKTEFVKTVKTLSFVKTETKEFTTKELK